MWTILTSRQFLASAELAKGSWYLIVPAVDQLKLC